MNIQVRSQYNITQRLDVPVGESIVIISIVSPKIQHPNLTEWPELKDVLRLSFHDIDHQRDGFEPMTDDDGIKGKPICGDVSYALWGGDIKTTKVEDDAMWKWCKRIIDKSEK